MYFADHRPPHFHTRYAGDEATIIIASGDVLAGSLRGRALRLVRERLDAHRDEWSATGTVPAATRQRDRSAR
jgi:hypothetical protein